MHTIHITHTWLFQVETAYFFWFGLVNKGDAISQTDIYSLGLHMNNRFCSLYVLKIHLCPMHNDSKKTTQHPIQFFCVHHEDCVKSLYIVISILEMNSDNFINNSVTNMTPQSCLMNLPTQHSKLSVRSLSKMCFIPALKLWYHHHTDDLCITMHFTDLLNSYSRIFFVCINQIKDLTFHTAAFSITKNVIKHTGTIQICECNEDSHWLSGHIRDWLNRNRH